MTAASKASSPSTVASKRREAQRCEDLANKAAKEAAKWQSKVADYGKEVSNLEKALAKALHTEAEASERRKVRDAKKTQRLAATLQARLEDRMTAAEEQLDMVAWASRDPKPEELRVLMLGASATGDLRIGREQRQIREAVRKATLREWVTFDTHPSATTEDLLDGIVRFRPHVVHFSGHGNAGVVVFDQDVDDFNSGLHVRASAFAHAIAATDDPPLLVVLNACHSAAQIEDLVADVVPFAIGMSDEIGDVSAIKYASRFYAAVAEGQSVDSAHKSGKAAIELDNLGDHDLPTLACAVDVDPRATKLVRMPE